MRTHRRRGRQLRLIPLGLVALTAVAAGAAPLTGAAWELHLLGVSDASRLHELATHPKQRTVKLAIVGQGGVSARQLASVLLEGTNVVYHDCSDPGSDTHDTQAARVVLALTNALGVAVELHLWQPGSDFADVADQFRQAGEVADIVCLYQSFWGPDTPAISAAIRQSDRALFVSPYVEVAQKQTSNAPQGSACKPWTEGSSLHFVTAAPLSRRASNGRIVSPLDRGPEDSEAINFIAPSYHASGPGGTCPAAEVVAACAVYLYAVMPDQPTPSNVIDLLRETATIDRELLTSASEFDDAAIDHLEEQIQHLRHPPEGKQRKLDAAGVLHLYNAYRRLTAAEPAASQPSD